MKRIHFGKVFFIILLSISICFCGRSVSKIELLNNKYSKTQDSVVTMLFVGNSLTYTNDLPALVTTVAGKNKITVTTEMLAFPNYALEDHWNDGKMQELLAKNEYDFVVVQQGPSSQDEGRLMLLNYGQKIKELCDQYQSKLAFFMVWPAVSNNRHFDGVIKNYRDAATSTNSILCPVGEVWHAHIKKTQDLSYYGPDGFHPSPEGSKKAAQIIVESLFR